MTTVFGDDPLFQLFASLVLISSIIGCVASLLIIIIIQRMGSKTEHVLLILWTSYFQFIYDVFSFPTYIDCGYYWTVISVFFHVFSGITTEIMTNWITFIALYIVLYRHKIRAHQYIKSILFTAIFPGMLLGIFYLAVSLPDDKDSSRPLQVLACVTLDDCIRLASTILNFSFIFIIIYRISATASKGRQKTEEEIAIRTLIVRMLFYPIVQIINRIFCTVYEFKYGMDYNTEDLTTAKYIILLLVGVTIPVASVGYLCIFLVMQPRAYRTFQQMLGIPVVAINAGDNASSTMTPTKPGDEANASYRVSNVTSNDDRYSTTNNPISHNNRNNHNNNSHISSSHSNNNHISSIELNTILPITHSLTTNSTTTQSLTTHSLTTHSLTTHSLTTHRTTAGQATTSLEKPRVLLSEDDTMRDTDMMGGRGTESDSIAFSTTNPPGMMSFASANHHHHHSQHRRQSSQQFRLSLLEDIDFLRFQESICDPRLDDELYDVLGLSEDVEWNSNNNNQNTRISSIKNTRVSFMS